MYKVGPARLSLVPLFSGESSWALSGVRMVIIPSVSGCKAAISGWEDETEGGEGTGAVSRSNSGTFSEQKPSGESGFAWPGIDDVLDSECSDRETTWVSSSRKICLGPHPLGLPVAGREVLYPYNSTTSRVYCPPRSVDQPGPHRFHCHGFACPRIDIIANQLSTATLSSSERLPHIRVSVALPTDAECPKQGPDSATSGGR